MNTAIVGVGNIGSRLAKNLATGGQKIICPLTMNGGLICPKFG